ncbi:sorting and assembly machinery component 50 homolog A-like [Amphiura filiformis]|uniref:sorting and assembly machinery component 50 homolog A-like n=1 Tax=Amphiura filiformis TaxID=82378 RepID=UPI003B2199B1
MGTVYAKERRGGPQMEEEEGTVSRTFSGNIKAKVQRIHIDGLARTKDDIVIAQVQDVFKAGTFKEVIEKSGNAKLKLERLGIFTGVGVFIDTSKGEQDDPDGFDITFNVKESRRITGSTHAQVGNNEGNLIVGVRMPNIFGRVETLATEYTHGSKHTTGYNVTFTKPFSKNLDKRFIVSGFKSSAEYLPSSYRDTERGIKMEINCCIWARKHSVRWEGVWRELACMTRTASFDVREQCGHSLKSSVKHIFTRDTRNETILPVKGYLVKLTQEAAGYTGGDVNFLKSEAELQLNKSLFWDWVLSVCLQGGVMKSMKESPTLIQDRFFLGGPTSVRGFNLRGLGPYSQGDSLGGEAYCAFGIHLYTPLPFRPGRGGFGDLFRTHFFINAGNLSNLNLAENNMQDHFNQLRETLRWSYGAGIVLRLGRFARFEINYCIPQTALATDSVNAGIQFGVGVNFL